MKCVVSIDPKQQQQISSARPIDFDADGSAGRLAFGEGAGKKNGSSRTYFSAFEWKTHKKLVSW